MTLTELRYLVAVAQYKHFGRAAKSCFVAQPTLSVGVKKLEEELGIALFERGHKNEVRITQAGELIIEQAQTVLEEAGKIKHIASAQANPLAQTLKVGMIYSIAPYLLPRLIPSMKAQGLEMPLMLEENYTGALSKQLKQGALDVIVISYPYDEEGLHTMPLYSEDFVAAVPLDHPLNQVKNLSLLDLSEHELILLGQGHCFRDQVLAACPECRNGQTNNYHDLQGGSLETICHMVALGGGVTVLPQTCAVNHRNRQDLNILKLSLPTPKREVALAWRKSFPRLDAINLLAQAIRNSDLPDVEWL